MLTQPADAILLGPRLQVASGQLGEIVNTDDVPSQIGCVLHSCDLLHSSRSVTTWGSFARPLARFIALLL